MAALELRAAIRRDDVEALDLALQEAGETEWMVVEDLPTGRAWLVASPGSDAAADEAEARLGAILGAAGLGLAEPMQRRPISDEEIRASFRVHFKRWQFGPLSLVPIWEKGVFRPEAGGQVLWLDPGLAFGTGNHETTRLCCERVVEFHRERGAAGAVVDAGCGCGILGLAAARLGFGGVRLFDLDPLAEEETVRNAALNGLESAISVATAGLRAGLDGIRADLLLANIQADVLLANADCLVGAVKPGGWLVLSGILAVEAAQVRAAFAAMLPWASSESRTMGEWVDVKLVAGPAGP